MENLFSSAGHLHPLLLHLPIGILILLVLLELGNLLNRGAGSGRLPTLNEGTRAFILFLLGVTTLFSAAFGLLLAGTGGYDETLLANHRLFGLISTLLVLVLFLVQRNAPLYGLTLCISLGVLVLAGHNGGSLTHGKAYLSVLWEGAAGRDEEGDSVSPAGVLEETKVFDHAIQPLLKESCARCHGDTKQKGGLRLDSWEALERGGESGRVILPGNASESPLIRRVRLPLAHEDHMPPEGKPQLSLDDIRLLAWWVKSGASPSGRLADLDAPTEIEALLARRLGLDGARQESLPDRAGVMEEAQRLEEKLGVIIQPLHPKEPWLEINARLRFTAFGDKELGSLEPLSPVIRRLDLGETAVTDSRLSALGAMNRLEVLKLDRTRITDAGLRALSGLPALESLTLFSTDVSDAGMEALAGLPALKSVYVWQTRVTPSGAARLQEQFSDEPSIHRLQAEIAELEARVRAEQVQVNRGESLSAAPGASSAEGDGG